VPSSIFLCIGGEPFLSVVMHVMYEPPSLLQERGNLLIWHDAGALHATTDWLVVVWFASRLVLGLSGAWLWLHPGLQMSMQCLSCHWLLVFSASPSFPFFLCACKHFYCIFLTLLKKLRQHICAHFFVQHAWSSRRDHVCNYKLSFRLLRVD
jgi:hypothetical protein